ncbi:MAG: TonB-dependent receptor plug domain-containing protein, partial [Steroidobacteraceae bacterium]
MAPAAAQTEGFTLEEIVVTATKRETALSDTGLSISAYTSDTLQQRGIDDVNDLSANTPGLTIGAGTNTERISIRGIGIDSLALGIDPAVAT